MAFTYGEYSESGDYTIEKKVKYIEYIESDGASWIDTGIITNENTQIEVTAELINFDRYKSWFGSDRVSAGYQVQAQNLSFKIQGNGVSRNLGNTTYTLGKHTWKIDTSNIEIGTERYTVNIDGEDLIPFTPSKNENPTMSLKVFSANTHGDSGGDLDANNCCIQGRIYDFKIYMDNELIMHLKPCLDASKVPCMYDEVTQTYFHNQGTGTFTAGGYNIYLFADNQSGEATNLGSYRLYDMKIEGDSQGIENNRDTVDYVDCLIGDEASYINTGIAVSTGYQIDVTFMSTSNNCKYENIIQGYRGGIYGASTRLEYSYDTEPYGISLGLTTTNIHQKNGGIVGTYGNISLCYNKKYTMSSIANNVSNPRPLYLFTINQDGYASSIANSDLRIYDFKIYNAEGTLIQHLRPCIDASKVPCMYDEVSQQYFYNQGTGTFGYKKELRDFQPILDKNGIPCLMDKINRKYYYDKNYQMFKSRDLDRSNMKFSLINKGAKPSNGFVNTSNDASYPFINTNFDTMTNVIAKYTVTFNVNNSNGVICGGLGSTLRVGDATSLYLNYNTDGGSATLNLDTTYTRTVTVDIANQLVTDENNTTLYSGFIAQNNNKVRIYSGYVYNDRILYSNDVLVYNFKGYDKDDNLIIDLIPSVDDFNIPCMYDKITQEYFYNQGEGEFSCEIEELECPPVDTLDYIDIKGFLNYDTGLTFDSTWSKIEFKFNTLNNINTGQFVRTNDYHWSVNYFSLRYNYGVLFFISKTNETNSGNFQIGEYNGILQKNTDFILTYTPCNWNINGVNYPMEVESLDSSIGNLILFPDFSAGENRFYSYKVWDSNGDLIQSLVPASDKDGKDCLYDEVNKNILYANGENHNKIGNMIDPKPIKYIESDGTQYIDTGVRITNNTSVDMACRETTMIDYISDGLIFNLDGIKNTRSGHVSDTTVWEDLSGNGLDFDLNDITITDNCMSFNGSSSYANIQDIELWKTIANNTTEYDVELCLRFTKDESYQPIISSNYGSINVAKFVQYLQFRSTNYGFSLYSEGVNYGSNGKSFTVSCNMNVLLAYFNTTNRTLGSQASDFISSPISDNFSIGTRLTGKRFWFNGDIYSIRIYNRHLTDEERLYNHSVDVNRFGVETDIVTVKTGNYIMNNLRSQDTYKYQDNNTTVQSNLITSEGATLTLGETNLAYLSEKEIEDATNDGWNLL